ncbi:GDP-L-fucose synthase [Flexistipes sinusarabici DSM 4947]|uniref:GDP-L-fucose synthase n=1 Tax=Flexistipes sinusarabici (strain ATCC 49648 / DSM 4947 / MAS 10) TaxID=717231 RepID=F8E8V2_FLESM|nr:GDP-L-fucose synthase [Flexistipes sinusarabici]AEI14076.1 GDP-L-fucose synthase [Flexistipes sinusarabici DSM 4947]
MIKNSTLQKSSKIFVAGGTGLVGSAIIKKLLEKGYTNIVASYHSRPPITNNQYTNTPITWQKLDLLDTLEVEKFFKQYKPEFVFLAAAKVGGIVANNKYRADFIYENLQIQNNVIHQSYKNGVKKLMFLGSTCIYPKECPQPMKEEYLLTAPLEYTNEPYAIAKIAGIKMCESYNLQYGTNFISVMPTNLYGPNDNFDLEKSHVLPALLRKMHLGKCLKSVKWEVLSAKKDENWEMIKEDLNKNPIEGITGNNTKEEILKVLEKYGIKTSHVSRFTSHVNLNKVQIEIWGSGSPRREFLWSEDMADACVFLMESVDFGEISNLSIGNSYTGQNTNTQASNNQSTNTQITNNKYTNNEIRNTHINIGTGKDISISELASLIKQIVGFNGDLYYNTDKPDGTPVKLTDPSKLHSLGWKHSVELKQGIEKMYSWYLGRKT